MAIGTEESLDMPLDPPLSEPLPLDWDLPF